MELGTDGEILASDLRIDRPRRLTLEGPAIHVDGLDDVLVRLSTCCTPVPGDEIMGFITKGRGVSVHRIDRSHAGALVQEQASRAVEVEW